MHSQWRVTRFAEIETPAGKVRVPSAYSRQSNDATEVYLSIVKTWHAFGIKESFASALDAMQAVDRLQVQSEPDLLASINVDLVDTEDGRFFVAHLKRGNAVGPSVRSHPLPADPARGGGGG